MARGEGNLLKELQNYVGNINKGNENKIILGDFHCTMDKMDRDGGNKTQIIYRCLSNDDLPKRNVNNMLEDL